LTGLTAAKRTQRRAADRAAAAQAATALKALSVNR
jgi:hypothetical protein